MDDNEQEDCTGRPRPRGPRARRSQENSNRRMDDQRRGTRGWRRTLPWCVVLLPVCGVLGGCIGPKAVRSTRLRYNEVMRDTNDQQLLLNIVRLRYADSPVFIDLPSI